MAKGVRPNARPGLHRHQLPSRGLRLLLGLVVWFKQLRMSFGPASSGCGGLFDASYVSLSVVLLGVLQ